MYSVYIYIYLWIYEHIFFTTLSQIAPLLSHGHLPFPSFKTCLGARWPLSWSLPAPCNRRRRASPFRSIEVMSCGLSGSLAAEKKCLELGLELRWMSINLQSLSNMDTSGNLITVLRFYNNMVNLRCTWTLFPFENAVWVPLVPGSISKTRSSLWYFFQPFAIASVRIRGASTKSEDLIKFGVDLLGIVLQGAELDAGDGGKGKRVCFSWDADAQQWGNIINPDQ